MITELQKIELQRSYYEALLRKVLEGIERERTTVEPTPEQEELYQRLRARVEKIDG